MIVCPRGRAANRCNSNACLALTLHSQYRIIQESLRINEKDPWKFNVGVPQGSCAEPILWLLTANEALNKFGVNTEVKVQAFADDFVVLISSTASYNFSQIGNSALTKLEKWAEDFSLSFSHEKSKFTMFKHRNNNTHIPTIKLLSKRIQYSKELKYLGLAFDPNFSWMPHLNKLKEKITKLQQKIYRILRATWGLKPEVIKTVNNRVGFEIVVFEDGNEKEHEIWRLNKETTVFIAEMAAIGEAVDYCKRRQIAKANIISDSRLALVSIEPLEENRKFILNIKNSLQDTNSNVLLWWTKAHAGNKGNERTDYFAKKATEKQEIDFYFCKTKRQRKTEMRKNIRQNCQILCVIQ
ncbi:hypothetical protein AVEN_12745-1 [Araneus ventricosus]|uniref:RNase H type-1 domain-containing protein n=1 Tax=Araneus ventricosus TaxID=182803 RepID=A0A4Y2AB77_ARAVE|nr:hypothetical protein AVEN_12745-1 [Araneus ventricosus]